MPAPIKVGNVTVHQVVEQEGPFFDILPFFPTLTKELLEENRAWMQPKFMSAQDQIVLCVQSYLVQTPQHNILIDTCVGNHKPRPAPISFWNMINSDRYQRGLAGTGIGVGEIDFVMCTHLHVDHVGWNTRLENGRWVPTFPNARYVFADRELAHWTQRHKDDPAACPWITDSVLPIVAANRVDIVKSTHTFNDLVTLIPTPGHTIDHYSVLVGRPGADAVITGDMIHHRCRRATLRLARWWTSTRSSLECRGASYSGVSATPPPSCARHTFPRRRGAALCAGLMRSTSRWSEHRRA